MIELNLFYIYRLLYMGLTRFNFIITKLHYFNHQTVLQFYH